MKFEEINIKLHNREEKCSIHTQKFPYEKKIVSTTRPLTQLTEQVGTHIIIFHLKSHDFPLPLCRIF